MRHARARIPLRSGIRFDSQGRERTLKEHTMERQWGRREVIKLVSTMAATVSLPLPLAAQQVKWSAGTEPAKLRAPANATDCHHHIYDARYPVDPKAALRPGDALVEDYRAL